MRPRPLMLGLLALVLIAAAGAALLLVRPDPQSWRHPERHQTTRRAPVPANDDIAGEFARALGPMSDVLPMHRAVGAASKRFRGRVLDITLIARPAPGIEPPPLVYRIRMLTPDRHVLDIRMDAVSGRIVDVRGADLRSARNPHRSQRNPD